MCIKNNFASKRTAIISESEVTHCASFLTMLRLLHSVTNKKQYKKLKYTWCIKIRVESMHYLREAISHNHKWTPSVVIKKDWNTKEDRDKSMMHALYILQWAGKALLYFSWSLISSTTVLYDVQNIISVQHCLLQMHTVCCIHIYTPRVQTPRIYWCGYNVHNSPTLY